ncbi:MAG: hypothetical protein HC770_09665 [Pseudanabaena sp. CRU_2_10]|nr:hypothetical protein [Pseudanabaena sp. CRU_2_10]
MNLFTRPSQRSAATDSNLQKLDAKKLAKWQEYCDLELIPTENSDRSVSKVQSMLALIENLWQSPISSLTEEPELNVWQKKDRSTTSIGMTTTHGRVNVSLETNATISIIKVPKVMYTLNSWIGRSSEC